MNFVEAGGFQQTAQAEPRVAKIVVGLLVLFPFERRNQQKGAAGFEDAPDLGEGAGWVAKVFDGDDVQRRVEGARWKRQGGQIGDGIESAIIPPRVAHSQIDAKVALVGEESLVLAFAGARVENQRAGSKRAGKACDRFRDLAFEVEEPAPDRSGCA